MQQKNLFGKYLQPLLVFSSLLWTTAAVSSGAAAIQSVQSSPRVVSGLNHNELNHNELLIAQVTDQCRRVTATGGLNVYAEPTISSTVIGTVEEGRNVMIEDLGDQGWVPIAIPLRGYISAVNLTNCAVPVTPASATNNCREVAAAPALAVRQQPSVNSTILGYVANQRNVTILNQGAEGWVPISAPIEGYVASRYLRYCS